MPAPPAGGQSRAVPLVVLLAAPFLAQADATIANVATPSIRSELHASGATVQLVIGGYLVAFAVLLITGARLGQTHGYRRLFVAGLAAFGVSSLVAGLAPDATLLIAMRVAQGAGAAMMFPQALTGIQLEFSGDARTRAIALFAIALSTGAVVGQVFGGVLVSADLVGTSWRPIFLVNVPVCLAALVAATRVLPSDNEHRGSRVDLLGVVVLSLSVLLVVVPLTLGPDEAWPAWCWLALGASVPAFAGFFATQRRAVVVGRPPLVNVALIAKPRIAMGLVALMTAPGTYYALLFIVAQYLQVGLGRSALASGLMLVPWVAAFGVAGQITRRLPSRWTPRLPVAGYLILTAAYLAIGVSFSTSAPDDGVLALLFVVGGLGLGTIFTSLTAHLTNSVPARFAADISGVSTTTVQIGAAVGVAGFGSLYLAVATTHGAAMARHGFGVTSLALGATVLVATFAAHRAPRSDPEHRLVPDQLPSKRYVSEQDRDQVDHLALTAGAAAER